MSTSKHLLISGLLFATCIAKAQDWEKADREIVRLSPSRFPELPTYVRKELERRGCTVPQSSGIPEPIDRNKPHNVIHGEFIRKGEQDWAVLCSVNRKSGILVFRGPKNDPFRFAIQDDFDFLQGAGGNRIAYSRAIYPATLKYIWNLFSQNGETEPFPIDHEGIDAEFVGKSCTVLYFHLGRWIVLTGAD